VLAFDASVMQSSKMRWMTSGEGAWGPVAGRDGPNMFRTADDQFRFAYTAKVVNRWINHDDDDDDDDDDDREESTTSHRTVMSYDSMYAYVDIHPSTQSIHMLIHPYIDPFIHQYLNPSIHTSIHSSIHTSIHTSIHPYPHTQ